MFINSLLYWSIEAAPLMVDITILMSLTLRKISGSLAMIIMFDGYVALKLAWIDVWRTQRKIFLFLLKDNEGFYAFQIPESHIFDTYGGKSHWPPGQHRGDEDRDGHAYMLIYRRVDPTLNALPMTMEELPVHIKVGTL